MNWWIAYAVSVAIAVVPVGIVIGREMSPRAGDGFEHSVVGFSIFVVSLVWPIAVAVWLLGCLGKAFSR